MKLSPWPRHHNRTDRSLARVFEKLFDRPYGNELPEVFHGGLSPAANISEDEYAMTVALELPGLVEEDIEVQILGNQLVVTAERRFDAEKEDQEFHRVEHQYGSFSRTIALPTGLKTDEVDAVYKQGILTLSIPKVEPTPAQKIQVKRGE